MHGETIKVTWWNIQSVTNVYLHHATCDQDVQTFPKNTEIPELGVISWEIERR